MKHPTNGILQDYFENALNPVQESLVKDHLLNCDTCTQMLSEMAVIERKMKEVRSPGVPESLKLRVLQDASILLQEKRNKINLHSENSQKRLEKQTERMEEFKSMWALLQNEFRVPALQFCSISLVLVGIVAFERSADTPTLRYEPISTKVQSYEFKDAIQAEEEK